jgi:RNA polymerase sigma-70 factor (family 1)
MPPNQLTDSDLWLSISQDDSKAFALLFDRYWSKTYRTAFLHLRDKVACTEITHDIFLNLWLKRASLNIESFPGYLAASARYHIFKHIKVAKAIPLQYIEDMEHTGKAMHHNNGDQKIQYEELMNKVESYLNDLPKRCKEIFILSRMENLSNDQIANRLQISKRTVENQITRALQHLRVSLEEVSVFLILLHIIKK